MATSSEYLLSDDYAHRVYAGVLGKIIGVYLGRPFEGWSNEKIERELGEVNYYVHERLGQPLVVTDDDISGTFTFIRALAENGNDPDLTAAQIGDWWRNTIIEGRTILWWGGLGMSTEHTAFLRLKAGMRAPDSGSIATNGRIVAEQIGAQIFVDGWGMVYPGDPEKAVHFAGLAASVSHDGEAKYGAQVLAAMEAAAFVERDLDTLLDMAAGLIPQGSVIRRLIGDVRGWADANGDDWRATLKQIQAQYGYDKFGGNCHMVPNHAVILLGLLHGRDDFQRSLMITNTAGWDTDCNSGNVGCLLGIKNGLAGVDAGPDWRGPVADRLFLPTADGGRCITDAVRETYFLINMGRALRGMAPLAPKGGARCHFSLPGSVQGFQVEDNPLTPNSGGTGKEPGQPPGRASPTPTPPELGAGGLLTVGNEGGKLALRLHPLAPGRAARVGTATFIPLSALALGGYDLVCSPTLYPGQTVTAQVEAGADLSGPVTARLYVGVYGEGNALTLLGGGATTLAPDGSALLTLTVPETAGQPVASVGIELTSDAGASGTVRVDRLTWGGVPAVTWGRAAHGDGWRRAWVNAASQFEAAWGEGLAFRVIQNEGVGLVTQGEWEWTGYTVSTLVLPHLAKRLGLLGAVRGLRRYVALVLDEDGRVRLVEQRDDTRRVLAESGATWAREEAQPLSLAVSEAGITAKYGDVTLTAMGDGLPTRGAVGLLADTGHGEFGPVTVGAA